MVAKNNILAHNRDLTISRYLKTDIDTTDHGNNVFPNILKKQLELSHPECVVRVRYDSDGRKRRLLRGNHRHHVCLFAEREVGEITFGEAFTCHARTKKDSEI
uniref:Uncharacterized protein n=1 Tax=Magallana gigas TaxID=29159 RepID=K1Q7B5_MAGGI